ncbi:MAG: hypothetical protein WBW01_07820 [Terriglobales bacterium]
MSQFGAGSRIRSAGFLAGCLEAIVALGSAGGTPAGQPPGRRRYNHRAGK